MRKTLFALFLILSAISLFATDHYVSATGSATWANSINISTPCSLATANSNIAPGDTVYLRAGTYSGITGSAIDPTNTGTAGNVITFSSYNDEDVQIVGSGTSCRAIDLDSDSGTVRSYIKIHDLHFTKFIDHLWIRRGCHNEISHCSFIGMPDGVTNDQLTGTFAASYIYRHAQYNWIHDCTFGDWGSSEPYGTDIGCVFQMGAEGWAIELPDLTKYNLVENCIMYHGGHHVVGLHGSNNVYRNNYFRNDPWNPPSGPLYSTRTFQQTIYDGQGQQRNLVEGNRIGYGGPKNKDEIGGAGGSFFGCYNIWRENIFLQIYTDGMWIVKYVDQTDVIYNKVYNNTYWHGGYGAAQHGIPNWDDSYTHAIDIGEDDGSVVHDNAFKNNLFYQNNDLRGTAYSIINHNSHVVPTHQVIANNWLDNAGDPKFTDITGTPDPTSATQFNFSLQSSSPCIDAGGNLTLANGSGSGSTALIVNDAGYFQDGSWSAYPGAVAADWIAIGTVTNMVQISAITYATNTITLASPMTWSDKDAVWLYKNSQGTRVLAGSGPDIGALENEGTGTINKLESGTKIRVGDGAKIIIKEQ